jgi:hypothetical protein
VDEEDESTGDGEDEEEVDLFSETLHGQGDSQIWSLQVRFLRSILISAGYNSQVATVAAKNKPDVRAGRYFV